MIHVCPVSALSILAQRHRPGHVISLLSPGQVHHADAAADARILALRFHDIAEADPSLVAPDAAMIEALVAFSRAWCAETPLLIHCWAGVSRSSAAAYIVACEKNPGREDAIAAELRRRAPFATPNRLMVSLADELLKRGGRMSAAIARIGRGVDAFEGTPYALPAKWPG